LSSSNLKVWGLNKAYDNTI